MHRIDTFSFAINKIFDSEIKRRLFENFLSLSSLQAVTYIFPLITLPYLLRVLGAEKYGQIAFAQVFINYFEIVTDYGFNLLATRDISIYRDDKDKLSEIFSSVMLIKLFLLLFSLIVISIIIFSFRKFSEYWLIYYLTFGTILGQVLFPVWFYQGIEKMKYIILLNIVAKVLIIFAIFIFVHRESDYLYVPLLYSLGFVVAGILGLFFAFQNFHIRLKRPKFDNVKRYMKEGWSIFLSRIYVFLYTNFNTFILGLMADNTVVGYFSTAQKITNGLSSLYLVSNQVIYPHMARLSKVELLRFTKKIVIYYLITFLVIAFAGLGFSRVIIEFIFGQYYRIADLIFSVLLVSVVTSGLGGILTQGLIILKRYKQFNQILLQTAILNMFISPVAVYIGQGIGLAISSTLIYIYVIVLCTKQLLRRDNDNVQV